MNPEEPFLSRWSRRKAQVRQGAQASDPPAAAAALPSASAAPLLPVPEAAAAPNPLEAPAPPPEMPLPTLDDVARLTPDSSDFSRFVAPRVSADVRNAAMKKLFTDPHFNVMDGLDVYIDDYGQPDPLPAGMLRQMAQSHLLGLFSDEPAVPATPATPALDPETADNADDESTVPDALDVPDRSAALAGIHSPEPAAKLSGAETQPPAAPTA